MVKAFMGFLQIFCVPDCKSSKNCRSCSLRGTSMVRAPISQGSLPWAVKPAGLNGPSGTDLRVKAQAVNSNAV